MTEVIRRRGVKYKHDKHAYRIHQIGNDRWMLTAWPHNRLPGRHVLIDVTLSTHPQLFHVTHKYLVRGTHLHQSVAYSEGHPTLPQALAAAAEMFELDGPLRER